MSTSKPIAIMGGTFDPIHNGHLHVANCVLESFDIEKVLFIPAGLSPFKEESKNNSYQQHRFNMTKIAITDYNYFELSDIEIKKQGLTFTVDTLDELRTIYQNKIYFIIGADVLISIYDFKNPLKIFSMCEIIIINRPDYEIDKKIIEKMKNDNAVLHILNVPMMDISSTKIRNMINRDKQINFLVPQNVSDYIKENNLYRINIDFDFEKVTETLKNEISPKRFIHIMGVCDTARDLARYHGENENFAHIAAILHDWAKEYPFDKLIYMSEKYGYKIDSFIKQSVPLCHGFLAAAMAPKDFGITDSDILNAIRYHTTGRAGMTMLEKIVFLADVTEPNRGTSKKLEYIRCLSYTNINKAMLLSLQYNFNKAIKKGELFHPLGLQALTYFHGI